MSLDYTVDMSDLPVDHPLVIAAREVRDAHRRFNDLAARYAPWRALPERIGVLYDEEHIDGEGGFHASDEDGGMWVDCITEAKPGSTGKTQISARALRAMGYEVPPFTGTPCPRCFGGT